jgi:hypothetical protein
MTATKAPSGWVSMPYFARPVTMSRASATRTGVPTMRKSFGSLSGAGFSGGGSAAASAATSTYARDRPSACRTRPSLVESEAGSAPQRRAAAVTSNARAFAPNWRWSAHASVIDSLPPAPCGPNRQSGVGVEKSMPSGICSTTTSSQRTSSSSAISIGSAVFTPWPISGLRQPMTMRSARSMRTKSPICAGD